MDETTDLAATVLPSLAGMFVATLALHIALVRWVLCRQGLAVTWRQALVTDAVALLGAAMVRAIPHLWIVPGWSVARAVLGVVTR